jgi:cysteine desulfurase
LICAATEHHAVLHAFEHLQKHEGFDVTYLAADADGRFHVDNLAANLRPETVLVSIMSANNETGVIQPIAEMAELCATRGILFHSDMVQSFGKAATDLRKMPVTAASFAAHKFYGPKGAGLLFLRAGVPIEAIQFGGAHENQRRPGTENVPAIAGMAAAAEWTSHNLAEEEERERSLRDALWEEVRSFSPGARLNGANAPRLGNTLNLSFAGISSETMLMALDLEGVCASSGSACMVGSVVASHVLLAMGLPIEVAGSAIRFSLGRGTTPGEITGAAQAIRRIIERLAGARVDKNDNAYAVV